MKPSSLYRSELWRAALVCARLLPARALDQLAAGVTGIYHSRHHHRREIVVENLLPVLDFDRLAAERTSRALFRQFGRKLADLWRYEAGRPVPPPRIDPGAWAGFEAVRAAGRGVLLVTPHIGNWEFGAPFLRQRGVSLQVITQAEPQEALTALRKRSRARWGIDTLVIGQNPFAIVEIIRKLEAGAAVALLVDRPPAGSGVAVQFFGAPFMASTAAADLAKATGSPLLPVALPRVGSGYSVEMLPAIQCDRRALASREARAGLTQELMRQFEPVVRRHADQWFHFVPLWQQAGAPGQTRPAAP